MGLRWWQGGVLGGLAGAAVFGLLMWTMTPEVIEEAIPALYGVDETAVFGGAIHLIHGVVLGISFGAIVSRDAVTDLVEREPTLSGLGPGVRTVAAGVVYGLALWVLLPVIVMPLWLGAVGFAGASTFPNVAIENLLGHAVYGLVLGAVYAAVVDP